MKTTAWLVVIEEDGRLRSAGVFALKELLQSTITPPGCEDSAAAEIQRHAREITGWFGSASPWPILVGDTFALIAATEVTPRRRGISGS